MGDIDNGSFMDLFHNFLLGRNQGNQLYEATFRTLVETKGFDKNSLFLSMEAVTKMPGVFKNVEEMSGYLEAIRTSAFVKKHWPLAASKPKPRYVLHSAPFKTRDGYTIDTGGSTERSRLDENDREINLTKDAMASSPLVAVHELAHLIQSDEFGIWASEAEDYTGHGPVFARINLMLVEAFLGKELGTTLEKEMNRSHVTVASRETATRVI